MYGQNRLQGRGNSDITQEMLLAANAGAYPNSSLGNLAFGTPGSAAAASRLLYSSAAADTLIRHQAAIQQQQHVVAAANAKRLSNLGKALQNQRKEAESKSKEIIEIDDSSDDDAAGNGAQEDSLGGSSSGLKRNRESSDELNHKRSRPTVPMASTPGNDSGGKVITEALSKRLKSALADGKTAADLPALSRDMVTGTLNKSQSEKIQKVLQTILFHATGYTAATAPKNKPYPPMETKLTITAIHACVKDIVKKQMEELKVVVETTIHHCTQMNEAHQRIFKNASAKKTEVPQTQQQNSPKSAKSLEADQQTIEEQRKEILFLRNQVEKLNGEKRKLTDELSQNNLVHARSVRAYMRASVQSLRHVRDVGMYSDSEEEIENDKVVEQE